MPVRRSDRSYKSITPVGAAHGRDSLLKFLARRPIAICPGALGTNALTPALSLRERAGVRAPPGTGFNVEKAEPFCTLRGQKNSSAHSDSPLSFQERVGVRAPPGTGFNVEKAAPFSTLRGQRNSSAHSDSPLSLRERAGVRAAPGTGFQVEKAAPFSTLRSP